jgi:hypothetical protein
MADITISSLSVLEAYLTEKINQALLNDVADAVRDELESSAIDVVLGAGEPVIYQRRSSSNSLGSGGIADKNTMDAELVANGVVSVTPNADRNREFSNYPGLGYDEDKSLVANIVEGYGDRDCWWNQPRDFVEEARENLRSTNAHISAMRDALIKAGLKVV